MARCSHLCIEGQLVKVIDLNQEMDSDSETNYILVVDDPDSPKDIVSDKQHVNEGPVFSLKCLHEDDEQHLSAESVTSKNITENTKLANCSDKDPKEIKFSDAYSHVNIDSAPKLVTNCDDDDSEDSESESSSDNELHIIHMDEVPELVMSPGQDNSQESASPSTNHTSSKDDKSMDTADVLAFIGDSNEQSILKDSTLIPVQNAFSNVPEIPSTYPSPSVPARNPFQGKYFFRAALHHFKNVKKNEGFVYCGIKNKLYISKDHPFKVLVSADSVNVPPGSVIKVTTAYCMPEHASIAVRRCPYHEHRDRKAGSLIYKHLIRSMSMSAIYSESKDGILSVSVPYEIPQVGELYTSYIFEITDYTSCIGGINRRPIMLIFTLEKDGIVFGRQTLHARICAAPYRDYKNERIKLEKKNSYVISDPYPKQSTLQRNDSFPNYTIKVKDPEVYQFLEKMKVLYELGATSKILINNGSL